MLLSSSFSTFFNGLLFNDYFYNTTWFFVTIFLSSVWFLLHYKGEQFMAQSSVSRFIAHALRILFKVLFPLFLVYRNLNNVESLMAWESYIPYLMYISLFFMVIGIVADSAICFSIVNSLIYINTLLAICFLLFSTFTLQEAVLLLSSAPAMFLFKLPVLLQLCASSLFCFSVASCLYCLILVYNKKPEAIFWLLISVALLTLTSFFRPFSLNVSAFLFYFVGYYFGFITVAIVLYYKQCKISMFSYLIYAFCLCFTFFNVAMRLNSWSIVLGKSFNFFNHAMHTYSASLDEANACFCIAANELSIFLNFRSFFNIGELLVLAGLVLLSYSLVTYNMFASLETKALLSDVQASVLILVLLVLNGTIIIGPTAWCDGGKLEVPTSTESKTFSEMLGAVGRGTSDQIAEWRKSVGDTLTSVKKAGTQTLQNAGDLNVAEVQKDLHSIAESGKFFELKAELWGDPLYQMLTGLTLGASGMVGALTVWGLYKSALAYAKSVKVAKAAKAASATISKDSTVNEFGSSLGKYSLKSKALADGYELYNPTCYAGPFVKMSGSTLGASINKVIMTLTKGF
jgi:hypothetical protein